MPDWRLLLKRTVGGRLDVVRIGCFSFGRLSEGGLLEGFESTAIFDLTAVVAGAPPGRLALHKTHWARCCSLSSVQLGQGHCAAIAGHIPVSLDV